MDDNNRRRRQNEPPLHPTNSRYHQQQQQQQPVQDPSQQARRSMAGSSSERYRPAPLNTSPPTAARTGMGGSAGYSAYYQEPSAAGFSNTAGLQPNTMGYHQPPTDYTQDTRQTQGFASAYPMSSMYNVPQASGQNPVYDTSNQFAPRQPAGLQMMPTDVGAPFYQSEPTNATAASALQQQTAPTTQQASGVYQQGNADRNNMLNYPSNMGIATIGTQQPANPPQPDVTMEDSAEYPAAGGLDEAYASYQTALREIFQNIRNGALVTASESLLNISEWLLGHVGDLGLASDDQSLHGQRIKLWDDFNNAWLALFQAQKDLMESGRQLGRNQSLITQEGLAKMGAEIVRLCDGVERHGLVDYQYGVLEEQIIDILSECVDLYTHADDSGGATAGSSANR